MAITMLVLPFNNRTKAFCIYISETESKEDVASSKIRILGLFKVL